MDEHSRPRAFTIASSHASTEVPLETVDRARSATVSPTLSPQPKRHTVASTPDLGGDQPAQSRHRKKRHVFLMGYLGEYTLDCDSADAQSIRSATLSVMRRIPASLGNEAPQALMALSTSRIRLLSPSDKATLCDFDVYRVHSCVRPSDSSFVSLVYVTRSVTNRSPIYRAHVFKPLDATTHQVGTHLAALFEAVYLKTQAEKHEDEGDVSIIASPQRLRQESSLSLSDDFVLVEPDSSHHCQQQQQGSPRRTAAGRRRRSLSESSAMAATAAALSTAMTMTEDEIEAMSVELFDALNRTPSFTDMIHVVRQLVASLSPTDADAVEIAIAEWVREEGAMLADAFTPVDIVALIVSALRRTLPTTMRATTSNSTSTTNTTRPSASRRFSAALRYSFGLRTAESPPGVANQQQQQQIVEQEAQEGEESGAAETTSAAAVAAVVATDLPRLNTRFLSESFQQLRKSLHSLVSSKQRSDSTAASATAASSSIETSDLDTDTVAADASHDISALSLRADSPTADSPTSSSSRQAIFLSVQIPGVPSHDDTHNSTPPVDAQNVFIPPAMDDSAPAAQGSQVSHAVPLATRVHMIRRQSLTEDNLFPTTRRSLSNAIENEREYRSAVELQRLTELWEPILSACGDGHAPHLFTEALQKSLGCLSSHSSATTKITETTASTSEHTVDTTAAPATPCTPSLLARRGSDWGRAHLALSSVPSTPVRKDSHDGVATDDEDRSRPTTPRSPSSLTPVSSARYRRRTFHRRVMSEHIHLASLSTPSNTDVSPERLCSLIAEGIPPGMRGRVWRVLARRRVFVAPAPPVTSPPLPNDVSPKSATIHALYDSLVDQTSSFDRQIRQDIGRTFPSLPMFQGGPDSAGQGALFRLMRAYSLYDPAMGYCQGLSFVGGLLLMHLSEHDAFEVFVYLLCSVGTRDLYMPDMEALQVRLYQFSRLLYDLLPELHHHLESLGVAPFLYAGSWFLTLFSSQFPFPFVLRVFDGVLSQGMIVVFRCVIALMKHAERELHECKHFESAIQVLKTTLVDSEIELLLMLVNQSLNASELLSEHRLDSYAEEYLVLKDAEDGHARRDKRGVTDTVSRLLRENAALRVRNANLERELVDTREEVASDYQMIVERLKDEMGALKERLAKAEADALSLKSAHNDPSQLDL